MGLATRRRSMPWVVLGGVHFSAGIGFLSSSSSSTAYSNAAWRILRRRLVTLGAAGGPSSLTGRPSRTCRSILGSRSADTGRVWLVAQRRALRTSSGQLGSSRRAVLNAQRFSAARSSLPFGWPRVLVSMAVVTAVSASAWVRLVVAATRGHFRAADAQAKLYQDMPLLARSMETGRPVP